MNRMLWIYFLTAVVFTVALWGILRAGTHLRAAPYVGGTWTGDASSQTLVIEQSGVFVRVRRDGAGVESYQMQNVTDVAPRRAVLRGAQGKAIALEYDSAASRLTLSPFPDGPAKFTKVKASTTRPSAGH